ncbi:hypothetical protein ACIPSE_01170 [Streptomyces sp. NPDC090106]|uniref:hypothetical protein n=1 Tax=Streptomyces sp. NPDC090106 TaxID=3365946 RepID=UPI003821442D
MARLNAALAEPSDAYEVLTDPDLMPTAKVVWSYLSAVSDPQRRKTLAEVLTLSEPTVSRCLNALAAKGLARRVNGVWVRETER